MTQQRAEPTHAPRTGRARRTAGAAAAAIAVVALLTSTCASTPTHRPAGRVVVTKTTVPVATVPAATGATTNRARTAKADGTIPQPSELQARIIEAAEELLRTQRFVVAGHRYNNDCTGTILAVYAMAGIRLVDLFPGYAGGGVQRLHGIAVDYDLLYHSELPQPGDLVFWDNTYDRAGDKQWNDPLTHVGLVLSVDSNGTVEFIHYDYTRGPVKAWMNLTDPDTHIGSDGIIVNSPMRMRSHRYLNPDEWLSSHLYRELGAMYLIDL